MSVIFIVVAYKIYSLVWFGSLIQIPVRITSLDCLDADAVADVVMLLWLVMITLFPGDKRCDQCWA